MKATIKLRLNVSFSEDATNLTKFEVSVKKSSIEWTTPNIEVIDNNYTHTAVPKLNVFVRIMVGYKLQSFRPLFKPDGIEHFRGPHNLLRTNLGVCNKALRSLGGVRLKYDATRSDDGHVNLNDCAGRICDLFHTVNSDLQIDEGVISNEDGSLDIEISPTGEEDYVKATSAQLLAIYNGLDAVKGTILKAAKDPVETVVPRAGSAIVEKCESRGQISSPDTPLSAMVTQSDDLSDDPTSDEIHDEDLETGQGNSNLSVGRSPQIFTIPHRRNQFFTGRSETMARLQEQILSRSSPILVIHGLGGIGKTQLAVECCYRTATVFTHVFWASAASADSLVESFAEIALCLQLVTPAVASTDAAKSARYWLSHHSGWLLFLDNADNVAEVEPFIPSFVAGQIIATSRASNFDRWGITSEIALEEFSIDDTIEFLERRCRRVIQDAEELDATQRIHNELGGLPLALEQVAAFVVEKRVAFSEYWQEFDAQRLRLLEKQRPQTGQYLNSVATTWLLNFSQVQIESEASADLLRFTAFLNNPDSIPFSYVINAALALPLALRQLITNAKVKSFAVSEALAPLARFSLVRVMKDEHSYTMHRLVQEVVRNLDET